MTAVGNDARTSLLDAAEQLFAVHGIDTVSSRRIAETAGNTNHSAVAYHFGGRDGLLRAIVSRHRSQVEPLHAVMLKEVGDHGDLIDYLRCFLVPAMVHLSELPKPSHRARALHQIRTTPSASSLFSSTDYTGDSGAVAARLMKERLADLDLEVVEGRRRIVSDMITSTCAHYEAHAQCDVQVTDWQGLGDFLTDAAAGMLAAPVTARFRRAPGQ